MSIRTVVEINHDHLGDLTDPVVMAEFARILRSCGVTISEAQPPQVGHIRILAQRHHSEAIRITVS